jgi:hypothetical protein
MVIQWRTLVALPRTASAMGRKASPTNTAPASALSRI